MTLKTLKDIEGGSSEYYEIFMTNLKQEAIKKFKLLDDHYASCRTFPFKILNARERQCLRNFIKWNNNLTEEDLQ